MVRKSRWLAYALFLLASLIASACGSATPQTKPIATNASTLAVTATIHLAAPAGGSHPIPNGLWFLTHTANAFFEIDPATNQVVAEASTFAGLTSFIYAGGSLWAAGVGDDIWRIDPTSGKVLAAVPLSGVSVFGAGFAADANSLWVADTGGDALAQIDLQTNKKLQVIAIDATPTSVTVADGSVWVCAHHSYNAQPALWRIDPKTSKIVAKIDTTEGQGFQCGIVTADEKGMIWVVNVQELRNERDLLRIDPTTNRVVAMASNTDFLTSITADTRSIWAVDVDRSAILHYDAHSDQLISMAAQLAVGAPSNSEVAGVIEEAEGSLWVQSFASANSLQLGPTVWRLSIIG
jgi:DNA-binding beta-propeller fold protein YncE